VASKAKSKGATLISQVVSDDDRNRPPLLFHCPRSGRSAATGIGTDVATLRKFWNAKLEVECPHCGRTHRIRVRETFLEGALLDFTERPTPLVAPVQAAMAAAG
jgi:hypothetical protein